jgi:hypothetical protein
VAIDENIFGPDHPTVAIRLSSLAQLLRATNRPGEAKLLMRRALAILIDFEPRTGHRHRDAAARNYVWLLAAMGKSEAEVRAAIDEVMGKSS